MAHEQWRSRLSVLATLMLLASAAHAAPAAGVFRAVRIVSPDTLRITLAAPLERRDLGNFRLTDSAAPDVPIELRAAVPSGASTISLVAGRTLDRTRAYRIDLLEPRAGRDVKPSPWAMMFTAVLAAALINNFVFTRYLGLCIFFGVSKRRDTALGMGATFAMVMLTTGMFSWLLYSFVLRPLELRFLQVLVFIGVVAFLVQMLDTILKKTHRSLHQRFGIYLVLITTNCIILAVPLLNAASDAGPLESFALSMGSGLGFAIALFLMSCARERVELAKVPESFQGLPIAFALAGLFALAFMGFSGLSFFR
jgi:electron transport complex protein RnfA